MARLITNAASCDIAAQALGGYERIELAPEATIQGLTVNPYSLLAIESGYCRARYLITKPIGDIPSLVLLFEIGVDKQRDPEPCRGISVIRRSRDENDTDRPSSAHGCGGPVMSPSNQIILSGLLTFGAPLAFAIRELIVLRRPPSGGLGLPPAPPPEPTRPRPLPDCLIPRLIEPPVVRVRELEDA